VQASASVIKISFAYCVQNSNNCLAAVVVLAIKPITFCRIKVSLNGAILKYNDIADSGAGFWLENKTNKKVY